MAEMLEAEGLLAPSTVWVDVLRQIVGSTIPAHDDGTQARRIRFYMGQVMARLDDVPRRLWPLPVERLWGVGPKSAEVLHRGGLRTIGEIARSGTCASRARMTASRSRPRTAGGWRW